MKQLQSQRVAALGGRGSGFRVFTAGRVQRKERPAPLCRGRSGAARAKDHSGLQSPRRARAFRPCRVSAQGVQRIVGNNPSPHQAPERVDRLARIAAARCLVQRIEETRARGFEHCEQFFLALAERVKIRIGLRPSLRQQRQLVGKKQRDAPVALADRLHPGPRHLARRDQRIEPGRREIGNARGQYRRFHERCWQRRALQVLNRIEQRIEMRRARAPRSQQSLPVREEARQRVLLHRLHFAAQPGQRFAANLS